MNALKNFITRPIQTGVFQLSLTDTEKNMYTLTSECVDKAMSELIVGEDDKWILIRGTCLDTNEVCYEGNFRCRFGTPYNAFYNVCLYQLIKQLVR